MVVVVLGCNPTVIESNDDDLGDDTTSESETGSESSSTSESGTDTDDTTSTTSTTDTDDTSGTTDTDDTTETGKPDDTTETGEDKHLCGWDPNNDWYFCGWEGEDPSMINPISCSEFEFPMVPGSACNGKLNVIGCCDEMGDAWYCINGFIEYEVCGGG
jgi:hypothetical protein